jgi:hypothetical protein
MWAEKAPLDVEPSQCLIQIALRVAVAAAHTP